MAKIFFSDIQSVTLNYHTPRRIELDVNSHSVDIFLLFSMELSLRKYILRREEYIPQNYRLRPKVPGLENILIVALVKIVTGGSVRNSCVVSKSSSQTLS